VNPITVDACRALAVTGVRDDLAVAVTIGGGEIVHVADSPVDPVPPSLLERNRTWRS
jgi:hypothetical protein